MALLVYLQERRLYVPGINLRIENVGAGEMTNLAYKAREEAKKASPEDSLWVNENDLLNRTPQQRLHSLEIALNHNSAFFQYAIELDSKRKEYDERMLITGPYEKVFPLSKAIDDNFKQAGFELLMYEFRHIPVIERLLTDLEYRDSIAVLLR